jgi:hypothetical protein
MTAGHDSYLSAIMGNQHVPARSAPANGTRGRDRDQDESVAAANTMGSVA